MTKFKSGTKVLLDNQTEVAIVKPHDRLPDRYVVESVRTAADNTILQSSVQLVHADRLKPLEANIPKPEIRNIPRIVRPATAFISTVGKHEAPVLK